MCRSIAYESGSGNVDTTEMRLFENQELVDYLSALEVKKSIYDYVVYDSEIEREFANQLDARDHRRLLSFVTRTKTCKLRGDKPETLAGELMGARMLSIGSLTGSCLPWSARTTKALAPMKATMRLTTTSLKMTHDGPLKGAALERSVLFSAAVPGYTETFSPGWRSGDFSRSASETQQRCRGRK
jgi:hypothetical protein